MGIIGFGDLGRKLRALITPFHNSVAVYDPWLPDDLIRSYDCTPVGLDDLLQTSRVVSLVASVTTENQGFIGKREFENDFDSIDPARVTEAETEVERFRTTRAGHI